jgi:hypothetical protein
LNHPQTFRQLLFVSLSLQVTLVETNQACKKWKKKKSLCTFSLLKQARLPDGLFSYQKSQLGYILEGLVMEYAGVFYDHLEYFTAILYILWPFGTACVHLVYFPRFGVFGPRKIWQPRFHAAAHLKSFRKSIFGYLWTLLE